ncbi:MAG: ribosome maturation factor RimM [Pseudomonadota bacterium]
MNETPLIALGRIGRSKGLKGEVYLDLYNPDSDTIGSVKRVFVGRARETAKPFIVRDVRVQSRRRTIRFEGIDGVEDVKALVGQQLFVSRKDLPALKKGEYYVSDLLGMDVESVDGEKLGRLEAVMPTPANDVYVVQGPSGERLFPAIPGVVRKIDVKGRKIVLNPPEETDAV